MLPGFVVLADSLRQVREAGADSRRFAVAPPCASMGRGALASESMTCRLVSPMLVTDKWQETTGSRHHRTYFHLDLRTATGGTYSASIRPGRLWAAVSVGQVVSTERWQDNVIMLSAGGAKALTNYHPLNNARGADFLLWFSLGWLGLFLPLFVLVLVRMPRGQ